MGRGRGPARRVPGGGGVGGGPVTPARTQRRRAPVRQHDSACREEIEGGARVGRSGEKERKMGRANGIVKFFIYSNNFQTSSNYFDQKVDVSSSKNFK
jgi:hypothetical protein